MRETDKRGIQLKAMAMIVMAMMAAVLMFGFMTIISHAEEVKVTATSVKIRASADVNSEMIGGAMAGESLTVLSEVTGADNFTWYQVSFEEGTKTGYVRSDCVSKTGGTTTTTTPTTTTPTTTTPASRPSTDVVAVQPVSAKVTGEQVRVRSNASTSGSIVSVVKKDVVLTVTGSAQDSANETWYQVSFSDANGQVTGFIRHDFVALEGEIVPADQVPVDPVDPVEPAEPVEPDPTPAPVQKDFDTQLNEDGWYLLDRQANKMYLISELFDAGTNNKKLYDDSQAQVKSMKIIMIILVVAVILLALTATLLFFKIRDMMDAAYFEEVEKETVRKRQGGTGKASMPTVGASNRPTGSRPAGQRPAGQGSAAQRPAGSGQQSRPAGSQTQSRPRPAGSGQSRPAGSAKPASGQARPAQQGSGSAARQQERPVSRGGASEQQNASRQSKNFMADDDEFDFEYLNWDGEEDN